MRLSLFYIPDFAIEQTKPVIFLQNKLNLYDFCRINYYLPVEQTITFCRTNYYYPLQNKLNLGGRTNYCNPMAPFRERKKMKSVGTYFKSIGVRDTKLTLSKVVDFIVLGFDKLQIYGKPISYLSCFSYTKKRFCCCFLDFEHLKLRPVFWSNSTKLS